MRYEGRGEDSPQPVSLTVGPGECVALTGPSGAGKSTLLQVLLGFVTPTAGRIRVAGVDLAELSPAQWRQQIAWVPQRPHLFAGTIAENVRLARVGASDAEVAEALKDAGAWEFVTALPRGVETPLGEGGVGLSAGQRQRLALARAFLADRPVLLLDEPTAALDGETEAGIVDAVRRLSAGRTVLLVVHRPALLAVADRVVEMAAGDGREELVTEGALPRRAASPRSAPNRCPRARPETAVSTSRTPASGSSARRVSGRTYLPTAVPLPARPVRARRVRVRRVRARRVRARRAIRCAGCGRSPGRGKDGSGSDCCSARWPSDAASA